MVDNSKGRILGLKTGDGWKSARGIPLVDRLHSDLALDWLTEFDAQLLLGVGMSCSPSYHIYIIQLSPADYGCIHGCNQARLLLWDIAIVS
jgi:hypothetical protein